MGTIIVNVCWSTNSVLYVIVFHSVGQDNLGHRIADKPRVFTDSVLHHAPYVKTGRGRSKRMHTTSTKKKKNPLCAGGDRSTEEVRQMYCTYEDVARMWALDGSCILKEKREGKSELTISRTKRLPCSLPADY